MRDAYGLSPGAEAFAAQKQAALAPLQQQLQGITDPLQRFNFINAHTGPQYNTGVTTGGGAPGNFNFQDFGMTPGQFAYDDNQTMGNNVAANFNDLGPGADTTGYITAARAQAQRLGYNPSLYGSATPYNGGANPWGGMNYNNGAKEGTFDFSQMNHGVNPQIAPPANANWSGAGGSQIGSINNPGPNPYGGAGGSFSSGGAGGGFNPYGGAAGNLAGSAGNALRSMLMNSQQYNPNGANTYGIQNMDLSGQGNYVGQGGQAQQGSGYATAQAGQQQQPQSQNYNTTPSYFNNLPKATVGMGMPAYGGAGGALPR